MQIAQIAAVLSFAAAAVAAPAPVAAPEAALEVRTTYPVNAYKKPGDSKYYSISQSGSPGGSEQFYCYQSNGVLNILNINCILNGNDVNPTVNVNIGDIDLTLLSKILAIVKIL